jgi:hypothetical protein
MVVDSHGQRDFGLILPDNIVVEHRADLGRLGQSFDQAVAFLRTHDFHRDKLIAQDARAQRDAFVADV